MAALPYTILCSFLTLILLTLVSLPQTNHFSFPFSIHDTTQMPLPPGSLSGLPPCSYSTLDLLRDSLCCVMPLSLAFITLLEFMLPVGRIWVLFCPKCGPCAWHSCCLDGGLLKAGTSLTCSMTTGPRRGCTKADQATFLGLRLCSKPEGCLLGCYALFRVNPLKQSKGEQKHIFCLKNAHIFLSGYFRITVIWC